MGIWSDVCIQRTIASSRQPAVAELGPILDGERRNCLLPQAVVALPTIDFVPHGVVWLGEAR
jgi:hypothetical protein